MLKRNKSPRDTHISFVIDRETADNLDNLAGKIAITRSALCAAMLGAVINKISYDDMVKLFSGVDPESVIAQALSTRLGDNNGPSA